MRYVIEQVIANFKTWRARIEWKAQLVEANE
jgi:hypothetical protein